MIKPSNGLVISYNYLWAREHDDRERAHRAPITARNSNPLITNEYRKNGL
jgi:hypothetical protein